MGSFSYIPPAVSSGDFLTHPVLFYVGSVSYTLCAVLCGEFVLYTLDCAILCGECFCYVGESITCPTMLYYVGSFSEMPHAVLCGEFVLLTPCCFVLGVSLKHPLWFHVVRVSYISDAILRDEFLLHGPCCFTWGVSLTLLLFWWGDFLIVCPVFLCVNSYFYTPQAILCRSFLLQFYGPGTSLSGEFLLNTPC